MTKHKKKARRVRRSRALGRRALNIGKSRWFRKKLVSALIALATALCGTILGHSYNERPIVYFTVEIPKSFNPDQAPLNIIIRIWNTGGTCVWVGMFIAIRSCIRNQPSWFVQTNYLTLMKISIFLIGRAENYTTLPLLINLQKEPEEIEILIRVRIRLGISTMFGEIYALNPARLKYRRQGCDTYSRDGG